MIRKPGGCPPDKDQKRRLSQSDAIEFAARVMNELYDLASGVYYLTKANWMDTTFICDRCEVVKACQDDIKELAASAMEMAKHGTKANEQRALYRNALYVYANKANWEWIDGAWHPTNKMYSEDPEGNNFPWPSEDYGPWIHAQEILDMKK